ncbi:MAG TPA: amidase family protein, partial [Acidimicrobiia bacterium]|nr:amidase family protein [Acidimicrobiia bacterium]
MDLTLAPAVDQLAALAAGDVSSTELLEATLDRYERFDPPVNAVVVTRIDDARRRAADLDRAAARGEPLGALHGIPMTVKEAFDWVGTPSTWGDPALADNMPTTNATAVDRLLDAGAVIYGKTNVPLGL